MSCVCVPGALLVHEPVVHHELDPRRGDHVEDRGRLECRAGQQLQAHAARARRHEIGGIRERLAQRDVAPEPHARAAHARTGQVVVGAIAGAGGPSLRRPPARWRFRAAAPRCRAGSSSRSSFRNSISFAAAAGPGSSCQSLVDDGHGQTPVVRRASVSAPEVAYVWWGAAASTR